MRFYEFFRCNVFLLPDSFLFKFDLQCLKVRKKKIMEYSLDIASYKGYSSVFILNIDL